MSLSPVFCIERRSLESQLSSEGERAGGKTTALRMVAGVTSGHRPARRVPPHAGHLPVSLITWPQETVPTHQPWVQADELAVTVTGRPRRQHGPVMGSFARVPDQVRAPGNGDPPAREGPRVNNVRFVGQDNVPAVRRGDHRRPPMTAEDNGAAVNHMAHQLNRWQSMIAESNSTNTYSSQQAQHFITADGHETPVGNVRTRHTLPHPANCQKRADGLPAQPSMPKPATQGNTQN